MVAVQHSLQHDPPGIECKRGCAPETRTVRPCAGAVGWRKLPRQAVRPPRTGGCFSGPGLQPAGGRLRYASFAPVHRHVRRHPETQRVFEVTDGSPPPLPPSSPPTSPEAGAFSCPDGGRPYPGSPSNWASQREAGRPGLDRRNAAANAAARTPPVHRRSPQMGRHPTGRARAVDPREAPRPVTVARALRARAGEGAGTAHQKPVGLRRGAGPGGRSPTGCQGAAAARVAPARSVASTSGALAAMSGHLPSTDRRPS